MAIKPIEYKNNETSKEIKVDDSPHHELASPTYQNSIAELMKESGMLQGKPTQ